MSFSFSSQTSRLALGLSCSCVVQEWLSGGELVGGPGGVVAVERVWLVFWPPMHRSAGVGSLVEPKLEVVVAPVAAVEAGWLDVVVA